MMSVVMKIAMEEVAVGKYDAAREEEWAPVADLMAALMLIFMFVAVVYVRTLVQQGEVFEEECKKIYRVLEAEFSDDFVNWQVDLLEDLTIRFRNPDILFPAGESDISPKFEAILTDFFPRYMAAVVPFKADVREIRIEGHTSSEFGAAVTVDDKYFENMKLSQARTREILEYVLRIPVLSAADKEWAKLRITANGLSSSKRLFLLGTTWEDPVASRRVEFRLLTSSCQKSGVYDRGYS